MQVRTHLITSLCLNRRALKHSVVFALLFLLHLTACRTPPMNKQEAADWYAKYHSMVRWVGYQGSDDHFHHFIARVMDDWAFIRVDRAELQMDDERPMAKGSSGPFSYYAVDPSRNFEKIDGTGRVEKKRL